MCVRRTRVFLISLACVHRLSEWMRVCMCASVYTWAYIPRPTIDYRYRLPTFLCFAQNACVLCIEFFIRLTFLLRIISFLFILKQIFLGVVLCIALLSPHFGLFLTRLLFMPVQCPYPLLILLGKKCLLCILYLIHVIRLFRFCQLFYSYSIINLTIFLFALFDARRLLRTSFRFFAWKFHNVRCTHTPSERNTIVLCICLCIR